MGINFVALVDGELCCGVGHLLLEGAAEAAQRASQELVSMIAAFRHKRAVFLCPGCQSTLSRTASFECRELFEFLVENLERIPFKQSVGKVVSLHDNCILSSMPDVGVRGSCFRLSLG